MLVLHFHNLLGNPFTKTLVGDTFTDPLMNAALCVDHCDQKGVSGC